MTQQALADAAGVSLRTVSDLERGVATTPQRETVRLLGDALSLIGVERTRFETAAGIRPPEVVPAAAAAAMRSLPRDVASFTGRQRELDQLTSAAQASGGVVGIHAIGGMAGVGKTAFAVRAAHRLADRFPGGQVFLPLHGHTPGQQPVDPSDALASLLLAAGVAPGQIPQGMEERAALWRDRIADKRLLLILDDAAGSDQIQHLLPGSGESLVLITSRRHLSALDDAITLSLDTLPAGDAAALLVRLAARPGLSAGDPGVEEISGLCGHLPLAVGMMARQLRHHPSWTAAGRAAELASARDRLGLMVTENLSVAAAFDLSYADLAEDQQQLFRRLGLHPGTDIDGYAAAALVGSSLADGRRGLEGLYDQYLLTESDHGRYRLHDLLREHARALANRLDAHEQRSTALDRLLDYYQRTSAAANSRIANQIHRAPSTDGNKPGSAAPDLNDQVLALAWARSERANLLNCLDHAAGTGRLDRVAPLTTGISGLLMQDGPWTDAVGRHSAAARAAQQLGDASSRANALCDLGAAQLQAGDAPGALQAHEQALDIYRGLGDRLGQANALFGLGETHLMLSDFAASALELEQALSICRAWGNRPGQAMILNVLATIPGLSGDYPAAIAAAQEALDICRELGDLLGQIRALVMLANMHQLTTDYPAAQQVLDEALPICREMGDRPGLARILLTQVGVLRPTGQYAPALVALEEALHIHRDLGSLRGQVSALTHLGGVLHKTGDYPAALRALDEALRIAREQDLLVGQGYALHTRGCLMRQTGDYPRAAQDLDQALVICRDTDNRGALAEVLNDRGELHRVCGETAARSCHQESLDLARAIDSPWDQANALAGLGRAALAEDDTVQARDLLEGALGIFERIGGAEIQELRSELEALTDPDPDPGPAA
jgi:tetratricopeptide (TPR) repeat protein/transcriptional regulator with XRE-family HTH domain